jgi:hypothetical protein
VKSIYFQKIKALKKKIKTSQKTKKRLKLFLKQFKICLKRDTKKAQKIKIGQLPNMEIAGNNHI